MAYPMTGWGVGPGYFTMPVLHAEHSFECFCLFLIRMFCCDKPLSPHPDCVDYAWHKDTRKGQIQSAKHKVLLVFSCTWVRRVATERSMTGTGHHDAIVHRMTTLHYTIMMTILILELFSGVLWLSSCVQSQIMLSQDYHRKGFTCMSTLRCNHCSSSTALKVHSH